MALNTTTPLLPGPLTSEFSTVTSTSMPGDFSDWVEITASVSNDAALAGIAIAPGVFANTDVELQFGIGTEGNETWVEEIGTIAIALLNSGNGAGLWMFEQPFDSSYIPAGSRVCARARGGPSGSVTFGLAIAYYENLDSNYVFDQPLACAPFNDAGVVVTPDSVAWEWSDWEVLFNGVGHEISIIGLSVNRPNPDVDCEFELGIGDPDFDEVTSLTTVKQAVTGANNGYLGQLSLYASMPVEANSIISVRVRQSGTTTVPYRAKLRYLDGEVAGTGTIIVRKITSPDSGVEFTFTTDIDDSTFTLSNGEQQTFTDVAPGTYSVEEEENPDYITTVYINSVAGSADAIELSSDETVIVTFRNTALETTIDNRWQLYRFDMKVTRAERS